MAENWVKVARTLGFLNEQEMWVDLYVTQQLSLEEIHDRLGYGIHTIIRRLDFHQIPRRPAGGARNQANQRGKLFHLDQRVVFSTTNKELSILMDISIALISKYKNFYGGKWDGVLHYQHNWDTDGGSIFRGDGFGEPKRENTENPT